MPLPSLENLNTILAILAFVISILSYRFARRSWFQSNRPIVSAMVETHAGGNESIFYNLTLNNTGNRPATNIRIYVEENDVDTCVAEWVKNSKSSNTIYQAVMRCFSDNGEIPLLLNGKTITNSFGYTRGDQKTFWRYGASLSIKIEYCDLDSRKYNSKQVIKVKDSAGFAGGIWGSSKNDS